MIGTVLKDTYRVVQPLGEGGMGSIYVAEHKTLPKRYAVKVLKSAGKASPELLARFEREARIASGLGHPNIVEVLDFDRQPDGSPFIVMELLDGEDLAARLAKGGAMDPATLLPVCRQLCAALAAAHHADIVHRDLKPQNVFLHRWGDDELVKVLDFGISKIAGGQTDLTADSAVIGTAHYMAPEQARGSAAEVDGRADLFSLGAIVFECLTGKRAFDGGTLPEIIHALCYGERPTLAKTRPTLADKNAALDPVLGKLLAVEREDRYDTVQAAWNDLAPALGGEATTLPLGKSTPDARMGMDATVAASPDLALDATVASDAVSPPGSVIATRAETPRARSGAGTDAAPSTEHVPTESIAPPGRGLRRGTIAVISAVAVALLIAIVATLSARSSCSMSSEGDANKNQHTTGDTSPDPRIRPSKKVTLAILPATCLGKTTDIAETLRESKLKKIKGLLLPPDAVDGAVRALAKDTGSRAGTERRVGHRLGATLLTSSRCVGKQVKVRVVRVSDGSVLATKLVDQPMTSDQLRDLVSLIKYERSQLLADLETQSLAASKAFKAYVTATRGGVNQSNYAGVIGSLEKTTRADPKWERPRFMLASLLTSQYGRTWNPALVPRINALLAPLIKPNGEFEAVSIFMQGVLAFFREDITVGLKLMNRAAMLEPDIAGIHRTRAQLYLLQGDAQLAQEVLQKASSADPGNYFTAVRLAAHQWLAGDFAAANKAIDRYVRAQDRQHRLGASDPDLRLGYRRAEKGPTPYAA